MSGKEDEDVIHELMETARSLGVQVAELAGSEGNLSGHLDEIGKVIRTAALERLRTAPKKT